jgi:hypothetical protein
MANNYFVDVAARDTLRAVRPEFLGRGTIPAATGLVVAGPCANGASLEIELVAIATRSDASDELRAGAASRGGRFSAFGLGHPDWSCR